MVLGRRSLGGAREGEADGGKTVGGDTVARYHTKLRSSLSNSFTLVIHH